MFGMWSLVLCLDGGAHIVFGIWYQNAEGNIWFKKKWTKFWHFGLLHNDELHDYVYHLL